MVSSITAGVVLGLSAGLAPGPLLALVITQTLRHGVLEGTKVALAPLITDLPIVLLSFFLLAELRHLDRALAVISLAGGLYVSYLAYECFKTRPLGLEFSEGRPNSLRKACLTNFLNPHPYLFWLTIGAPFTLRSREESLPAAVLFIASFYVLLVGSKIALAWAVGKARGLLTGKVYPLVMRLLGILLAIFAGLLLKEAVSFLL